jgi:hypothetical protein
MKTASQLYFEYLTYLTRNDAARTPMSFEAFCTENDLSDSQQVVTMQLGHADPMHY